MISSGLSKDKEGAVGPILVTGFYLSSGLKRDRYCQVEVNQGRCERNDRFGQIDKRRISAAGEWRCHSSVDVMADR